MSFPERVAARAADITLARVVLSIVAAPLYVAGFVAGVLVAAVLWCWAACAVGFGDARKGGAAWRSPTG